MLTFPTSLKIYLAVEPVDMRNQYNGLWALAEQKLQEEPAERGGVRVHEQDPGPAQDALLGWDRGMDLCEAPGERPAELAGGQ